MISGRTFDPPPSVFNSRIKQQLYIKLDHVAHHELIKAELSLFHLSPFSSISCYVQLAIQYVFNAEQ